MVPLPCILSSKNVAHSLWEKVLVLRCKFVENACSAGVKTKFKLFVAGLFCSISTTIKIFLSFSPSPPPLSPSSSSIRQEKRRSRKTLRGGWYPEILELVYDGHFCSLSLSLIFFTGCQTTTFPFFSLSKNHVFGRKLWRDNKKHCLCTDLLASTAFFHKGFPRSRQQQVQTMT